MVKNYGISFGLESPFFIYLNIFFLLFFLYLSFKRGRGYWLIFMGGLLNLIERFRFGHVRDYWNLLGSGLYNNINDWIIGLGVLICLFDILWKKQK